jgi:glycine betaine/choline ABC-type transport system substrate-binding protein
MRTEAYEANSEPLEELFGTISGRAHRRQAHELNARVDVDGEAPRDVAADFLSEIGVA